MSFQNEEGEESMTSFEESSVILALLAPGSLRQVSHFMYALDEACGKDWDIHVTPWESDSMNWIAIVGSNPRKETPDARRGE